MAGMEKYKTIKKQMKRKGATTKKGGTKLKEENEGKGQVKTSTDNYNTIVRR